MKFKKTNIDGSYIIDLEKKEDSRGFFSRSYCKDEFLRYLISDNFVQSNISFNKLRGTIRGMHYQTEPALESKLVRCIRGSICDVIVDLRKHSKTYMNSFSVELNNENRTSLYIPSMCAHGYQTLTHDSEILYLVGGYHSSEAESGIRYDDPLIHIDWPLPVTVVSPKDLGWPLLMSS
jgi:dTDP-4-dehydrorhamnose 3,5-epimerase